MEWVESANDDLRITNLTSRLHNHECILNWHWPDGLQFVYIHKASADAEPGAEPAGEKQMKLYTIEEYKANGGFRDKIDEIGRFVYSLYPFIRDQDGSRVVRQTGGDNVIRVSTGKAKVDCRIKYKSSLFGKTKLVRIAFYTDISVPKEALCYVKKEGGIPMTIEDGTVFPFIRDIGPGSDEMTEFPVGKNDYVKVFFTDGKKYAEMYQLFVGQ
ncbi:beta-mannanase [Paenibacillus sp. MBLB4367]|uniref:beta-mannanase n=1 Tax=Paenibacillus sp. MBLB4367 TaxID=3384767 RepID=UPI0039082416